MGDPVYNCPLCCNTKFTSKQALVDHLSNITSSFNCPVCSKKYLNIAYLIKHLKVDNCVAACTNPTIVFEENIPISKKTESNILNSNSNQASVDNVLQNETLTQPLSNSTDGDTVVTEAYADLINKQLAKPCLQGQELKFIKEEADGQYLLMSDGAMLNTGSAVVTKQNKDGTISLNTVNDTNLEPETEFVSMDNDNESKEIYTCNTCGVSFTSVSEHIQNYHNDQVVVVEGNDENCVSEVSIELEPMPSEDPILDRQISRRMITDTGDIVEAPLVEDPIGVTATRNVLVNDNTTQKGEPCYEIEIDKYSQETKKNKKDSKSTYCHKSVVLKQMQTETGSSIKVYNCTSCHLYVTSLSQFRHHPCKKTEYSCPHCPITYNNSKSLSAHMKVHKVKTTEAPGKFSDQNMKFLCDICTTVFPTSKSFKLHKRMHDPIKSRPIEAPVELPFGSVPSEDKYLCLQCDKLIPVDYRSIHQNSHNNTDTMICDVCNKKFESREYLDMHMTVHNVDKVVVGKQDKSLPYDCLYCNRKFARPHEKVKHERIHTGEKPHSCEICGKSFRVSYCLTLHMRTHTGARPYACPHCNKRFKAHSVFNHHLLTHSEVRAYKCPYCPKAFKTSVQLAGHRNSHTKPFSCQQCNRPFASLYAVRVHMESHQRHNSLKFACSLCGASYARAFALNDHVRQAHRSDIADAEVKSNEWNAEENIDAQTEEELPALNNVIPEITELPASELIVPS